MWIVLLIQMFFYVAIEGYGVEKTYEQHSQMLAKRQEVGLDCGMFSLDQLFYCPLFPAHQLCVFQLTIHLSYVMYLSV